MSENKPRSETGHESESQVADPERRAFGRGIGLGRVFGIHIRLDFSLIIVFTLIVVNLGLGWFPANHPDWAPLTVWATSLAAAVVFFASILAHEMAHALVGRRYGVPVDAITLFVFGGMAHVREEPKSPKAEFLMAAVGPLASLAIGLLALLAGALVAGRSVADAEDTAALLRQVGPVASVLLWLGPINILLAVFNLVPGFPLDGGRVLRAILWRSTGSLERATHWASNVGRGFAFILMGTGLFMVFGGRVPLLAGGLIQGLWLLFIGWFLDAAALQANQQVQVARIFKGIPVRRLMRSGGDTLAPEATVQAVADRFLAATGDRCLPVVDGDGETLAGIVCLSDLAKVPRASWPNERVSTIMTPAKALATADPDEDVTRALTKLTSGDVDQVPVIKEGRLQGILRRADVLRWLEVHRTAT